MMRTSPLYLINLAEYLASHRISILNIAMNYLRILKRVLKEMWCVTSLYKAMAQVV